MAISTVSKSRISPTMITLGSCLKMERSAPAKVNPISGLAVTWFIPSNWYSTGSSTVTIFLSGLSTNFNIEYKVVVLPLPVGPQTSNIPCGRCEIFFSLETVPSLKPNFSISSVAWYLSSMRIATFSPKLEGSMDTRKSTSLAKIFTLKRPSWGSLCSAIFKSDITFKRETMEGCMALGGDWASCNIPSMRKRILSCLSNGSMSISEAFFLTASSSTILVILITGVSRLIRSNSWSLGRISLSSFMTSRGEKLISLTRSSMTPLVASG